MKFILLLAFINFAVSEYTSNRPCPERPVMQNFDLKRIAGTWYNVMQYEDVYASSFLCGHGNYTVVNDHELRVHECEMQNGTYACLTGIISLNEPNRVRLEGKTSYAYFSNPTEKVDEFKYMAVEYDQYAVVYECKDMPEEKSIHSLWVASRTPTLSESTKEKIDLLIDQHFDRNAIKTVNQSPEICEPRVVAPPPY